MLYFNRPNAAAHPLSRGEMAYFMAWVLDDDELSDEISFTEFYGDEENIPEFWSQALLPEDCYEDEYYDEVDQTCYLIEANFTDDASLLDIISGLIDWSDTHGHAMEDDLAPTVTYALNQEDLILISNQASPGELLNDSAIHELVWKRFKELIPTRARSNFVELVFFFNEEDSTAAYVEPPKPKASSSGS